MLPIRCSQLPWMNIANSTDRNGTLSYRRTGHGTRPRSVSTTTGRCGSCSLLSSSRGIAPYSRK
jgi:hypothetical protein